MQSLKYFLFPFTRGAITHLSLFSLLYISQPIVEEYSTGCLHIVSDYELIFRFRLSALTALSHSLAKVSLGTYNCRKSFRDVAKSFQRGFAMCHP